MSKNYVQDGTTVEWVNDSGKTVLTPRGQHCWLSLSIIKTQ
ncbi:hypothetical protein [Escherichia fergusonii]|nr:hypothetical protein [Escherichia fergusonii]